MFCVIMFQYMSEKIGGAKGTELDDEFIEMEKVFSDKIFNIFNYPSPENTVTS